MQRIKKGDKVVVISGKHKQKTGIVLQVFTKEQRAIVEGVNMIKRHTKENAQNQKGGVIEKEAPIHLSNLALLDLKAKEVKPTKVKYGTDPKTNQKVRLSRKTNNLVGGQ
ncbi:50S ribosomal protein L24 [Mycoplasma bradburyae]|uniref:Large ribosomal subunit protein uL24 n=1 Tax=Mycoplasma bradburyae TaxID=2963128 RepID=A0AAW6HPD4_9MOLU|nr:50S ribosomal protein L24 [Mycoplasma bradburyae]MDC4163276.1 50S ribosomal protein L24 [Mycoplasma bradburyae]MDC4181890.1 50S ribosomal protein L24 [Mycoplasma bradburyae]MDC4182589.1 50S ribosomal protein L24 [Mycoplasma bradburyae]MDC4183267.1 50S ribosomal protein L24 [Mycoplasma bradburyae]MDC4184073.1 50S ribosomal protein L24 [Mycoplasma bradburyae]